MKIIIEKPCQKSWKDMKSMNGGKFCESCQSSVTDYSQLSKIELNTKIETMQGNCGRFTKTQMDWHLENVLPEIVLVENKTNSFFQFPKSALALSLLTLSMASCTQSSNTNLNDIEDKVEIDKSFRKDDFTTDQEFENINNADFDDDDDSFVSGAIIESQPEFPGGLDSLYKIIRQNFIYPEQAKKDSIQGKVYVTFTIDTLGYIQNPEVVRGRHPLLDQEAIRLIKTLPKYKTPAKLNGKSVPLKFTIPIRFRLKE
ncbi:MAG: energy transducer TonB [Flavobacteriales bacterium]